MNDHRRQPVLQNVVLLTLVMAAGWAVCFWPARSLGGGSGVLWMSIAAICCLVPGWLVVFLSRLAIFSNDLNVLLAQTMLRMFSVAVAALMVKELRPELGVVDFFGWLIGFYLLALATEVWMLFGRTQVSS